MLSASSFSPASSKIWRGLVVDSVSSASGRLRYSVALMKFVSMTCSFRAAICAWKAGAGALFLARPKTGELVPLLLPRKGFKKALLMQVLVPERGEALVLPVEVGRKDVLLAVLPTRILLSAGVVVAKVERAEFRFQPQWTAPLEAHLRVAHEVAVLFAIVRDGESGLAARAGFRR